MEEDMLTVSEEVKEDGFNCDGFCEERKTRQTKNKVHGYIILHSL